ncbi:aldo/keto reductase [Deinococcus sp.]|uniref:aldo/keto reductase n=1 Tax=Deinococcus sp. TaxID=47478 RepID=UPI0028698EEB|nr:aldo/keto reductase [Deinococcus sp.]
MADGHQTSAFQGLPAVPLGMGGSFYGVGTSRPEEAALQAALEGALASGITHFDTATDYGAGASERRLGQFLSAGLGRRGRVFLASKANLDEVSAAAALRAVDASLERLGTDVIDLYYLHWPRTGHDLRPWMEGLERARQQGKIRAVGVSNFSVAQMRQLSEAGRIDACQIGYNLLWRFPEAGVLPYCVDQGIAVVAYSALAHGILAGRYEPHLTFAPDDQRWTISLFRPDVWPQVYAAVQEFVALAARAGVPLATLALRWLLSRPGVGAVLVSARSPEQVRANVRALEASIPAGTLDELTALSDGARVGIPDDGNPFGYHP